MQTSNAIPRVLSFGRCELLPHHRELRVNGKAVPLGSRAFDLLMMLVEGRGRLVTKDELLSHVWRGIIIEENTLQVQMSALRKALGADREALKTISGHGYRFVADITTGGSAAEANLEGGAVSRHGSQTSSNLPALTTELIGREADVVEVLALMRVHRLVTLGGPGGIGKTQLAIEAARQLLPQFRDGVWLAELAPLSDPKQVVETVARTLGCELQGISVAHIATALASKQALLVLDNCEHVIDAATNLAEAVLRASPTVRVMATSRELLRAEGERVFQVPPLEVASQGATNVESLLQSSAVKLFMACACSTHQLESEARIAAVSAEICRRLDGIPLAIELAAARVPTLGVAELARRLDDPLTLLSGGRRTALPRQQSLRASLCWSYALLSPSECTVLQRLSMFDGHFSLEAASTLASSADIDVAAVVECVSNLVSKSLVVAQASESDIRYSLLHTTRAYAREKLADCGEPQSIARCHGRLRLASEDIATTRKRPRLRHQRDGTRFRQAA